jgi:serpin B
MRKQVKASNLKVLSCFILSCAIAVIVFRPGSAGNDTHSPQSQIPPHARAAVNAIDASNGFAFDFYARTCRKKPTNDNIFFSPFSISSAITMIYEGARQKTADEIRAVFHLPNDLSRIRNDYRTTYAAINATGNPYTLNTANALWVQNGFKLQDSYVKAAKQCYDGSIASLDFLRNPATAVSTINRWVSNKTAGKIKDLLSLDSVGPTSRLILTNAIYFKGEWQQKFAQEATQNKDFTPSPGSPYKVAIMEHVARYNHAELSDVQLLELPYKGTGVSMIVLLPKSNDLAAIEKRLSNRQLQEWISKMEDHRVDVTLPKFKIETKESLADDLKAMGMKSAFLPANADFSGIASSQNPSDRLYLSSVIHQTFIDNNEEGTEAAAATFAGLAATAMPQQSKVYIFNANHPFVFLIRLNQTSTVLFLGRIAKP